MQLAADAGRDLSFGFIGLAYLERILSESSRHHVIITGTGRAGTTFLLQLLMRLGMDTGYTEESFEIFTHSNAGSEWDIARDDAPYVVKSPWLCDTLEDMILRHNVAIDHAIIPVRNLHDAAESRRAVVQRVRAQAGDQLPGGLMYTDVPELQEAVLAAKQMKLLETLAKYDIKHSLLYFPKLALDSDYLLQKLSAVFGPLDPLQFLDAFNKTSRPGMIHRFTPDASSDDRGEEAFEFAKHI